MYAEAREKKRALNDLLINGLDHEMEKCTFVPIISARRSSRSFDEFLEDQKKCGEKHQKELKKLKEERDAIELSQRQPSPNISQVFFE